MKTNSIFIRRSAIGFLAVLFVQSLVTLVFLRPPAPVGDFPSEMSDAGKRRIVAAANGDALRQTWVAVRQGRFHDAWLRNVNSRKRTVRGSGEQGEDSIHVSFGWDDPAVSDGWAVRAMYFMQREDGRWMITPRSF